jgi:hypothetical protein
MRKTSMNADQFRQSSLLRHTHSRHGLAENVNIGTGELQANPHEGRYGYDLPLGD